jgi:hypothetical protein
MGRGMTIADTTEEFRIGRVVSRLFNALFANAVSFLTLTALLTIPSLLLSLYTVSNISHAMGLAPVGGLMPGGMGRLFETSALSVLVYLVFSFLLQAALTQGTIAWLNGENLGFGQSFSAAVKNFVPLVVIAILSGLGMMLGLVLLIVPGVIVSLMWSVVVPACVVESTGITESFGRSRALTSGYRGKIFLLFLAYFLVAVVLDIAMRPLLGVAMLPKPGEITVTFVLVGWATRVVLTSITAVGVTSIYYELRLVKEGIGAQQMAAAFD